MPAGESASERRLNLARRLQDTLRHLGELHECVTAIRDAARRAAGENAVLDRTVRALGWLAAWQFCSGSHHHWSLTQGNDMRPCHYKEAQVHSPGRGSWRSSAPTSNRGRASLQTEDAGAFDGVRCALRVSERHLDWYLDWYVCRGQ